jgi:hypothetical protein
MIERHHRGGIAREGAVGKGIDLNKTQAHLAS